MPNCIASPAVNALALLTSRSLPAHLDGSEGTNRGTGHRQIIANRDWDAVQTWLAVYKDKRPTYLAYEKEVTRFYLWVLLTLRKPLSSVIYDDWIQYREFLEDPQPREMWVSTAKRPRISKDGTISPAYRPFAGKLRPRSIQFAERAIWQMFDWLQSAGYLATNPLILLRGNSAPPATSNDHSDRILPEALWSCVLVWLAKQPRKTDRQNRSYARCRWMIALFYGTGLRSSEAIAATMGDIFSLYDRTTNTDRAFIKVVGKGAKLREVPLTEEVLKEMRMYRTAFGLSPDPRPGELTPLLFSIQTRKGLQAITRQSLYTAFKKLFDAVASDMEKEGSKGHAVVRSASTHWLRHMAASAMLKNETPLLVVRDMLGHADISTTSIYAHSEVIDRHREVAAHNHLDLKQEAP